MIEKLGKIEERYNELTQKIGDPEIIANNREWKKLAKEHSDLTPIIVEYEKLKKCVNSLEEDEKLLKAEIDSFQSAEAYEAFLRNHLKYAAPYEILVIIVPAKKK